MGETKAVPRTNGTGGQIFFRDIIFPRDFTEVCVIEQFTYKQLSFFAAGYS